MPSGPKKSSSNMTKIALVLIVLLAILAAAAYILFPIIFSGSASPFFDIQLPTAGNIAPSDPFESVPGQDPFEIENPFEVGNPFG